MIGKKLLYIGCSDEPFYGEGEFTIGEEYEVLEYDPEEGNPGLPCIRVLDDEGRNMYEELKYFTEVPSTLRKQGE